MISFRTLFALATLFLLASTSSATEAGTLVVANQGDGTISFVDLETFEVTGTIDAGNGPHEATSSVDGDRAFVSMYGRQVGNDRIAVVDPEARVVEREISVAPHERPHGIAWRNGSLFVTLERSGAVMQLDPSGKVLWTGKTGGELGHMLAVDAEGTRVYTGNMKTSDISVLEVGREEAIARIPVGAGPEGIALSPDGAELWVAHRMGGGLSVIDTEKLEVVAKPGEGIFSARLSFTPDGRRVLAFDMATRNVVVFDRDTRSEIGRYQPEEGIPVNGLVAPDSKTVWVIRYQPDAIFELDLDTLEAGRVVETGSMPDGVALVH